jgi:hypothetical protein
LFDFFDMKAAAAKEKQRNIELCERMKEERVVYGQMIQVNPCPFQLAMQAPIYYISPPLAIHSQGFAQEVMTNPLFCLSCCDSAETCQIQTLYAMSR